MTHDSTRFIFLPPCAHTLPPCALHVRVRDSSSLNPGSEFWPLRRKHDELIIGPLGRLWLFPDDTLQAGRVLRLVSRANSCFASARPASPVNKLVETSSDWSGREVSGNTESCSQWAVRGAFLPPADAGPRPRVTGGCGMYGRRPHEGRGCWERGRIPAAL